MFSVDLFPLGEALQEGRGIDAPRRAPARRRRRAWVQLHQVKTPYPRLGPQTECPGLRLAHGPAGRLSAHPGACAASRTSRSKLANRSLPGQRHARRVEMRAAPCARRNQSRCSLNSRAAETRAGEAWPIPQSSTSDRRNAARARSFHEHPDGRRNRRRPFWGSGLCDRARAGKSSCPPDRHARALVRSRAVASVICSWFQAHQSASRRPRAKTRGKSPVAELAAPPGKGGPRPPAPVRSQFMRTPVSSGKTEQRDGAAFRRFRADRRGEAPGGDVGRQGGAEVWVRVTG